MNDDLNESPEPIQFTKEEFEAYFDNLWQDDEHDRISYKDIVKNLAKFHPKIYSQIVDELKTERELMNAFNDEAKEKFLGQPLTTKVQKSLLQNYEEWLKNRANHNHLFGPTGPFGQPGPNGVLHPKYGDTKITVDFNTNNT